MGEFDDRLKQIQPDESDIAHTTGKDATSAEGTL